MFGLLETSKFEEPEVFTIDSSAEFYLFHENSISCCCLDGRLQPVTASLSAPIFRQSLSKGASRVTGGLGPKEQPRAGPKEQARPSRAPARPKDRVR